jgi:predicted PurR-regulated permease PerM
MKLQRLAINAAVVMATLTVVFLLYQFRQAVILFVFSLAVAASTRPYVEALTLRGVRRGQAIILVYLLFISFLILIFVAAGSQIIREVQVLADSLAQTYDMIWTTWPEGSELQRRIVQQLPAPADLYARFSPDQENSLLQGLLGATLVSAGFIGQLVTVLILSIYWSIDRVHFERLWLSVLPVESRSRARDIWRNIERDFGAYIRSEVLQSIFAGLLFGFGLWAMGVPYPALLGLFAALAWLIPWLGAVLAVLPVTLSALSQGLGLAIFATAYVIGVLFFLEFYIESRFIRRQQYSSLLTILLIIAMIEPFGLWGLIVAPPLAASIQLLYRYNLLSRTAQDSAMDEEKMVRLRARILLIRRMATNQEEEPEPQTINLLERLEDLLDRSDQALEEKSAPRRARSRPEPGG